MAIAPPRVARRLRRAVGLPERDGLLVRAVEDGSPGGEAGIERGDLIVAAAGNATAGVDALYAALDARPGGRGRPRADPGPRHRRAHRDRDVPERGGGMTQLAEPPSPEETEALDAYSRAVIAVAERLAPSVASLRVMRRTRGGQLPAGAGSAVVLTPDGFLLTSAHVVGRSDTRGRATFVDGREERFEVVGRDPLSDLACCAPRAATSRRPSSATPSGCAWASSWWRSATRTASAARSPRASCRRSAARCPPARGAPAASSTT